MEGGEEPLISETDYKGALVTCTRERWHNKVEARHPELKGRHEDVAQVIRDPHFVFQDRDYGDREQHYRHQPNGLFLKVVVGYSYDTESSRVSGRLVTAFIQDALRAGDAPLYVNFRR